MIRFNLASYGSLHYVLEHLCEMDRTELLATAWDEKHLASELANRIMQRNAFAMVASDERPITAFGLVPLCPGVGVAFAFSTTEYARAVIPVTRFIRKVCIPTAIRAGYRRIECRAMARPYAARWMKLVGAKPEAILERFGNKDQSFVLYRWLAYEYANERAAKANGPIEARHSG